MRKYRSISSASNSLRGGDTSAPAPQSSITSSCALTALAAAVAAPKKCVRRLRARGGARGGAGGALRGPERTVKWEGERVYGESVWFEYSSVARAESAPCSAGRSTMRASVVSVPVTPVAALTLILAVDPRRLRSRGAGKSASVEGGVGTDCVCVCELDSCVCRLDGDTARRGGEWYNGGVGTSKSR